MRFRAIAGFVVAVWVILFAIEFLEDSGVFEYEQADMDRAVNATLASLGDAISISTDDSQTVTPAHFFSEPSISQADLGLTFASGLGPHSLLGRNAEFRTPRFKIYSLHENFLF